MYVIRYSDGAYNMDSGFPCRLFEATRYATLAKAEAILPELTNDPVIIWDDTLEVYK